jgi:hypothetical protein
VREIFRCSQRRSLGLRYSGLERCFTSWCPTFRGNVLASKRRTSTTQWQSAIWQKNGDFQGTVCRIRVGFCANTVPTGDKSCSQE